MDKKTSTILLRVSLEQKELWVGQAHDERVSLSEWIRRRCMFNSAAEPAPVLGSERDVRPDPKSK
jgi:hypothetical protein